MSKANRKTTTSLKATAKQTVLSKDQKIIQACVTYGVMIGAINGENAEAATNAYYKERTNALKTAGGKAMTAESIRAKARVLSLMIADNIDFGSLEETETTFAASVARDVEAFFRGLEDAALAGRAVQS